MLNPQKIKERKDFTNVADKLFKKYKKIRLKGKIKKETREKFEKNLKKGPINLKTNFDL